MATAVFTTVEARVNQQLTNAIWADEIQDNINQLAGSHNQLLVNGGFEVWHRGAGPFTGSGFYTADRWYTSLFGGTNTVTLEFSVIAAGAGALKNVVTSPSAMYILQRLEDYRQLRLQTVSLSVRVQQSVASGARAVITDSSGTTVGGTSVTTGSFLILTVTRTLGAAITSLDVGVEFLAAGTYYVDNAMLVVGPAPAPYQPLHPADDLARCQRYYEVHGGVASSFPAVVGIATAGAQTARAPISFAVSKGGTPTLTKNGTWGVTNAGQPTAGGPTQNGYFIDITSSAAGVFSANPNSSDDTLTAEFNP